VEAEVADRGPGIPAAQRERVFEPFESTKNSAGLGLSICHSIIRQHEGELSVHDREGGGSLFRVRLRAGAAPEDERDAG
jgi:two-component system C4-dicarboxylate transport sensor histidine kinase DctB